MDKKILIVAPHPDDEVLGCGGIIKKYSKSGQSVYVLIMTRGSSKLYREESINNTRKDALKAHDLLGIRDTIFLDYPAPDLDLISLAELSRDIYRIIRELNVGVIFLPNRGDIHHDHKAVFNAGLVAARPNKDNPVKQVYSYETLSETEWAAPFSDDAFIPDYFVNISDVFNTKLEAMRCFTSQLKQFPHPRSLKSIEALANFRGSTVGFTHAEAFMTIRIIEE